MKKIGEFIVNRKQVCKIGDIITRNDKTYYYLIPIEDKSLKLVVPTDSVLLRDTITEAEINELIEKIPFIEVIKNNDKLIENEYKALLNSGNHEDLIKVIKTTYKRNQDRIGKNKKISDKDNEYFELAEKYLYNELSVVLNMNYDDTKNYVISILQNNTK